MKTKTDGMIYVAVLLAASRLANAAGFALMEQNASGSGNAFAGAAAVAADASTIFFNPAGMSYLPDSQLVAAGHAVKPSASFDNKGSSTINANGSPTALSGSNGGDAGILVLIPNFYYAKAVNDTIHLGIGVDSPFGLQTQYNDGWVGRYQALSSSLQTININPSISFKATDSLSFGGGFSAQYADVSLTNALDMGTICYGKVNPAVCSGVLGLTPQNNDGSSSIKGNDWGWGFNLGVIYQPIKSTRIGVAYRSQVHHVLQGNATFSNIPTALASALPNGNVTANLNMPDSLSGSVVHQLNDQWELLADATWTGWSSFNQLNVVRTSGALLSSQQENWTNTMRYSIGTSYRYSNDLKVRVGTAYDESPVPNAYRTPLIPDGNRIWLSLGVNYKLTSNSSVDAGYTYIIVENVSVNQGSVGSATGQLIGNYNSNINVLGLQYTHTF